MTSVNPASIPSVMRALILDGVGFEHLHVRTIPVPRPGPRQVLARVDAAGICTSLIKLVEQGPRHKQVYDWDITRYPLVLGDEGSVTLVEIGQDLRERFHVGQRYVIQPAVDHAPINHLDRYPDNGRGVQKVAVGYTLPGHLAEYVLVTEETIEAECLLPVSDAAFPFAHSSMSEPFSCVISAQDHHVHLGQDAPLSAREVNKGLKRGGVTVIIGAGAMGRMHVDSALRYGPRAIIVAELLQGRLDLVRSLFGPRADDKGIRLITVNTAREHLADVVRELTGAAGADDVIVAVGSPKAIEESQHLCGRGAVLNLFGGLKKGEDVVDLDTGIVHYKEINVTGSSGGSPWDMQQTLALMFGGEIDAGAHITRIGDLEHAPEFLSMIIAHEIDGKAIVYPHRRTSGILKVRSWTGEDERAFLGHQAEGSATSGQSQISLALQGNRTFLGFGFGAIQAGLFLYEAFRSGNFARLVAAEIAPDVVRALRQSRGRFTVNIAHSDHIEAARVGPVEIGSPSVEADLDFLTAAVTQADEISTAVPSVNFYVSEGPGSIHRILAEGLLRKVRQNGPYAVVYCAENHNHAAQILQDKVFGEIAPHLHDAVRRRVKFLNTVIGKMSGVVPGTEADKTGLETIAPGLKRAFLVESFNRILISSVLFEDCRFERGIQVFSEKDNLLPFEEAKLYGHNAVHALCAYLGNMRGVHRIAELKEMPEVMAFLRAAFLDESGEALIRKNAGVDALFTRTGYTEYADDLLARMVNPFLRDTVDRVGRDPDRKIGWNDRLVGTMRVALSQHVKPSRFAVGAAAALVYMDRAALDDPANALTRLQSIWCDTASAGAERRAILDMISEGFECLQHWARTGRGPLENEIRS